MKIVPHNVSMHFMRCELNLSYISRYTIENLMFFETEIQKIVSDIVRLHPFMQRY